MGRGLFHKGWLVAVLYNPCRVPYVLCGLLVGQGILGFLGGAIAGGGGGDFCATSVRVTYLSHRSRLQHVTPVAPLVLSRASDGALHIHLGGREYPGKWQYPIAKN